jgi:hypothetical protein
MRVKIHVDQDLVKPLSPGNDCITVCTMGGEVLARCRKLELKGHWTLRQYNNSTPCGASVVLYPESEDATYNVVK